MTSVFERVKTVHGTITEYQRTLKIFLNKQDPWQQLQRRRHTRPETYSRLSVNAYLLLGLYSTKRAVRFRTRIFMNGFGSRVLPNVMNGGAVELASLMS